MKILSGHPSVLKLHVCKFLDLRSLLVWAAEGKTGLLLGAFIIGLRSEVAEHVMEYIFFSTGNYNSSLVYFA